MRVYVAGCGGMLGEAVHKIFSARHEVECSDIDLNAPWLKPCDFRDFARYETAVTAFKPDVLIHLGAHTDLEYCEREPDDAYRTNTLAVEHACTIANALGIPLVFISTAGIFDGEKSLYDDWDQPNPLGHYARSKFAGEKFVAANCRQHLVCRAGWMMGAGPTKDKKFIQKLMQQLKAGKTELHIVDDKLGTPTYTRDFARNVDLLLQKGFWGIYNMVCSGVTSRLEVAEYLVGALGLAGQVKITPVPSDYFAAEYFAARPPSERLLTKKLDLRGLNIMRDWRICLDEYLAEYYEGYLAAD